MTACNFEESETFWTGDRGLADTIAADVSERLQTMLETLKAETGSAAVYLGRRAGEGEDTAVEYFMASEGSAHMIGEKLVASVDDESGDKAETCTFGVFEPPAEEEGDAEAEEGAEAKPPPPPRVNHVPNVLRSETPVKFFRFPMLGAYLACVLSSESSVHGAAIPDDGGLVVVEEEEGDEAEAPAEDAEAEGGDENKDGAEGGEDGAEAPPAKEKPKPVWLANKVPVQMVVGMDTMGQARPFTAAEIAFVQRMSEAVSDALSRTSDAQYQAEMAHRARYAAQNAVLVEGLAEAAEKLEADVAAAVEAAGAPAADAAAAEGEDAAAEAPEVPEDVKEIAEHRLRLAAAAAALEPHGEQFKQLIKYAIAPAESVQAALQATLVLLGADEAKVNAGAEGALDWGGCVKLMKWAEDVKARVDAVTEDSFVPALNDEGEVDEEANEKVGAQEAALKAIDLEELGTQCVMCRRLVEFGLQALQTGRSKLANTKAEAAREAARKEAEEAAAAEAAAAAAAEAEAAAEADAAAAEAAEEPAE